MPERLTFADWWRVQGRVLMDLAGAEHSRWSGAVIERLENGAIPIDPKRFAGEPPDPDATKTQPIHLLGPEMDFVELMFDDEIHLTTDTDYVHTLHRLVRRQLQMLRPAPTWSTQTDIPDHILRLGADEVWIGGNLDEYASRTGLLADSRVRDGAFQFEPEVLDHLDYRIAVSQILVDRHGYPDWDLAQRLMTVPDEQLWEAVAAHRLDRHPGLEAVAADPDARADAIGRITKAMRKPLARLPHQLQGAQFLIDVERIAGRAGRASNRAATETMDKLAGDRRGLAAVLGKVFPGLGTPIARAPSQASEAQQNQQGPGGRTTDGERVR